MTKLKNIILRTSQIEIFILHSKAHFYMRHYSYGKCAKLAFESLNCSKPNQNNFSNSFHVIQVKTYQNHHNEIADFNNSMVLGLLIKVILSIILYKVQYKNSTL